MPLPLGGTSNHFRRSVLEKVGGWDPFNVTEDADIGFRLARFGYRSATIDLPTMEDAPVAIGPWFRQRARWIKGWMRLVNCHARRWRASVSGFVTSSAVDRRNAVAVVGHRPAILSLSTGALRAETHCLSQDCRGWTIYCQGWTISSQAPSMHYLASRDAQLVLPRRSVVGGADHLVRDARRPHLSQRGPPGISSARA
jgi:hypothetical protein